MQTCLTYAFRPLHTCGILFNFVRQAPVALHNFYITLSPCAVESCQPPDDTRGSISRFHSSSAITSRLKMLIEGLWGRLAIAFLPSRALSLSLSLSLSVALYLSLALSLAISLALSRALSLSVLSPSPYLSLHVSLSLPLPPSLALALALSSVKLSHSPFPVPILLHDTNSLTLPVSPLTSMSILF